MSRRSSTASSSSDRGVAPGQRVLHLDAFSGIAGNMFLAAMIELGLPRKQLEADLAGLRLPHALTLRKVARGALAARYLDVKLPGKPRHKPKHAHDHSHGRHYHQIVDVIEKARLASDVRERALAIFEALGRAEARVHGTKLEQVHFHEVGAVDAIVDITGAAIALSRLEIQRVSCSPPALGSGRVATAHGLLPLPAPATLELLRGIPTVPAHVEWETVTPTGAAILATVVDEFSQLPAMTIERIGLGAGDDRPGPMPNVLRAVLGRATGVGADRVALLETHLDDLVPEHFDYLMERLFEAGALDVSLQHIQMKKNRPGFLLRVLSRPSERLALASILFAESTAIGVRTSEHDRMLLAREQRRVQTEYGRIGVKLVRGADGNATVTAEYDDCKRAAKKSGAPLRDVVRAAEAAGRDSIDS